MKKTFEFLNKTMYLPLLILFMIIFAFSVDGLNAIFGLKNILLNDSILITDYIEVGGIGAAFLNSAIMTLLSLILVLCLKLKITGWIYAGILSVLGYSFFGKNILNFTPILIGIFIYSKIKKIELKSLILTILLSSGISPLVSFLMFSTPIPLYYSIPLGILIGILLGVLIPPLVSHTVLFHKGYNLLNMGFALGILSMVANGILHFFNVEIKTKTLISQDYHFTLLIILASYTLFLYLVSILKNPKLFKNIPALLKRSGRMPSDYIRDYGRETVLFNIATIQTIFIIITLVLRVKLNGATFGAILTMSGFASAGLHFYNAPFILLGAIFITLVFKRDITSASIYMAIIFSLGLCPISGRYKGLSGLFAGMLHMIVVPLMLPFQGGFVLYNNGLAAGFVACILIITFESFIKEE